MSWEDIADEEQEKEEDVSRDATRAFSFECLTLTGEGVLG